MASVLAAGDDAMASDATAGPLWKIEGIVAEEVHVSTLDRKRRRIPGVVTHQR